MPPPNATSTATSSPTATVTRRLRPRAATPSATATATPTTFRDTFHRRATPRQRRERVTPSSCDRVDGRQREGPHGASWGDFYDTVPGDSLPARDLRLLDALSRNGGDAAPELTVSRDQALRLRLRRVQRRHRPQRRGRLRVEPAPPSKPDFTTLIRFGPWIRSTGRAGAPPTRCRSRAPPGDAARAAGITTAATPVGDLATVKRHPLWSARPARGLAALARSATRASTPSAPRTRRRAATASPSASARTSCPSTRA